MRTPTTRKPFCRFFAALTLLLTGLSAGFAAPTITTQPTNTTVDAGGTATFTVVATGTPPLSYHWEFKGVPINGATASTYTLTNISDSQGGNYSVQVSNGSGSTNSTAALLTVLNPPIIISQPLNLVLTNGDEAIFSVGVDGDNLNYQWLSNNVPLSGETNSYLEIVPVAIADAASYSVIITNTDGSVTSTNALLTVVAQQLVTSQSIAVPVNTCTNITFSVVTYGTDLPLSYQWYKDGSPVGNSSSYTVSGVQFADAGTYSVTVSDSQGASATTSATITVTDPPPVVITQNITVYLDATGNASITAAQVNNGSYDNCSISSMSVSPGAFTCANVGPNIVTLYVTDNSNQTSSATATVTVMDTNKPTLVFNSISVQLDNTGNYTLTPADMSAIGAGSAEACGIASYSVTPSTFGFCNAGSNVVTLTVTDVNGNSASTNGTITVLAPSSAPQVVVVDTNYTGSCAAVTFPFNGGTGTYYIGYNAFSTIQAGLNASASGGTVNVAPGTYNEDPHITHSVALASIGGNSASNTFIVLKTTGSVYSDNVDVGASSISIKGFTIVGFNAMTGVDSDLAGIDLLLQPGVTNIEVANNVVEVGNISINSNGDDGKGLLTSYATAPPYADGINVHDNIFEALPTNSESVVGARAFYINPSVGTFTFDSNTITGNLYHSTSEANDSIIMGNTVIGTGTADSSGGFAIYGSFQPVNGNATITGNVISNTQNAIILDDAPGVTIANNDLDGNGTGIALKDVSGGVDFSSDLILDNSLGNESVAAVDNEAAIGSPNAVSNWWGNISGPYSLTLNPYGSGSPVVNAVTITPWLNSGASSTTNGFTPSSPTPTYPPVQLVFTTQPVGANLGSPLSVQPVVQLEDTNGNVTPWANPLVTNSLGNDSTFAVLAGTNPQQAANGVATFTDLYVTESGGSNLTLIASTAFLPSATSSPFNVTNPAPMISSINPFYARAGGGDTVLTVMGSDFAGDSVVYWNGMALVTTYVSSSELTAIIPAGDISSTGSANITVGTQGPGGGVSTQFQFNVDVATPPVVYVDNRYTGLAANTLVDWPYDTNTGPHIIGYDAFAAIQDGADAVATNGTVNVAAGVYAENLNINQPLTLLGPNATNNPNTGIRVPEAVIEPATSGPDPFTDDQIIVYVYPSNVTIKGFTVDGSNPALMATNAVLVGTNLVNAAEGIVSYEGVGSIAIANNIIKDTTYTAVDFYNYNNGAIPTADNHICCNRFDNLGAYGYGVGVLIYNNFYAQIDDNVITNVVVGVQTGNFSQSNPGTTQSINNNNISANGVGIFFNLMYDTTSTFTVSNNAISFAYASDSPEWDGMLISSIQSAVSVNLVNNNITGTTTNEADLGYATVGYNVWNTPTTGTVSIAGGLVSNANYGVWVNDYDGYLSPADSTTATITGVNITGSSVVGVYVQDDPRASTDGVLVQATVTGNTVVNNSGLGVWVQGTNAGASVLNNSASITGNGVGVSVDTGVALLQGNDLTGNSIAGIVATNGAVVDAGNCTGVNVTGLGISTGGNNLSGYGFDNAAPWAIYNGNTGGSPIVLADHDNFGAVLGQDITTDFSGPVEYTQTPALIAAPTNVMVVCASSVPAGATDLAGLIAQGGYYSGNNATVGYADDTNFLGSGVIHRTYTVTDGCGVASMAVQTITVSDTVPPVFTVTPTNAIYPADLGQCSKANVTWVISATDNCDLQSVVSTPPSGSTFPKGTTTVTTVATDASGNTATNTFTVTIIDTQPPMFTQCATNTTIDADATAHASLPNLTGEVIATDNCGSVTISQIPPPGTVVNLGPTVVTLWATDSSGNSNSCTATVTVIDVTPPTITCPPDVTVTVLQDKDPYATGTAHATDAGASQENQPIVITYTDNTSGLTNCDATGTILRTWTAVDPSNNTNTCVQTITVIDNIAPIFTFVPTNIITTNDLGQCAAVVDYPAPKAVDVNYEQGFEDTNWVSSTNYGSLDWNDYNSHVVRVASGTDGIPASSGSGYAIIDSTVPQAGPDYSQSGAYANLGGNSSWDYASSGYGAGYSTPFDLGYKVKVDVYLNLSDPAVTGATPTTGYGWDLSTAASTRDGNFLEDFIFHTAAYGSNGIVIAADNDSNDNPDARRNDLLTLPNYSVITNSGWYTFEWQFRDAGGVLAVDLKVRDTNHAVLFSQTLSDPANVITNVDGRPNYTWFIFVFDDKLPIDNTVFERVTPVVSSIASGSSFPVGTTTVTNTTMDSCGNTTNTTFTVTVNDVQPPFIPALTNVFQNNDPGQCSAVVDFDLPTNSITDNCGVATIVATPPSGSVFPVGTNLVTVVVTDIHANTATNTFNVIVNDTEPPSANVPVDIVQANDVNECGAVVDFIIPAQTDNCGIASSNATPASGTFFPVGTTPVTVVVTDIHGNSATNTFSVTVHDTQPPVVNCPSNIVQGVDPGQTYATVTFTPTAMDNCGISSIVPTPASGSHFNIGTNVVNVVATDIHGNTSDCSFTIQVVGLPQITQQPMSRTNNQGTTATFSVVATSPTPLSYQWKKNGIGLSDTGNISGSSTATLTVSSVSDSDVAAYSVCVSNLAGTVLSSNANLTVIDPPVVASQPANTTNNATTTATFTVSVNGTAPFGFQWYKNGTNQLVDGGNISGSLTNVLTLSNVLAADRGEYSVVITNPAGTVTSSNAVLAVVDPWIATQPVSVTQPLGGTATFSVVGVGTAPLTYVWQQNNVSIPGATNSSYIIGVIRDSDSGNYDVIVSSVGGSVTSSMAMLTVTHPPVFVSEPQSQTVIQGQTASFNVSMNGTTPFSYQWMKNSTNIPGANGHTLILNNVTTNDAGVYDVFVTNPDGSATSSNAVLTVIVPPFFVTEPESITNNADTTATFTVMAGGTALAYQWYENGTNKLVDGGNISGSMSATLTLSNVLGANDGTYSVVITNLGGSLTSSNATLTVIDPLITNEPSGLTVVLGSPASFSVGVAGTSPAYQWRQNGIPINGATNSSYLIAAVADASVGNYDVVVTNIYGSVTSTPPAVLTVLDPVVITSQPASATNNAGTTATFSVVATGTAPLTYQWRKGTTNLMDGGNISGSASATLTISGVSDSDVASYSVVITNVVSVTTSSNATLTVIDPPVLTSQPTSLTNDAGTTASFSVTATGTAPLVYQWKKGVVSLSDGGNISGSHSSTLMISGVTDSDVASYSVVVTNAAGTTNSASATLTVIDQPVITSQPVSRTNNAGTTATFSVAVTGTAPLSYQWKKGAANLSDVGNISGSMTSTLTITGVSDNDMAGYSVVISNAASMTNSVVATLTVIDPPVITNEPVSITNNAGTTATFTVLVSGTTPLSYQWYKNGTNQLSDSLHISGSASNVLTLSNVFGADRGQYSVIVTNAAGSATSTNATLSVIDPYIAVQPTNTIGIDGTTVSFSVTVVGTAPLSYQWRQDDSDLTDGFGITGSGTSTLTISDVADSDAGNYSVVITNSQGQATSVEASLTTVPPLIVFQPTNVYVLVGQPFSFSVEVNGTTPFSYQWQKNSMNINGATNRIYSSSSALITDTGSYQVIVTNPDGTETSTSAQLHVYSNAVPTMVAGYSNGYPVITLQGIPTFNYVIQASSNLVQWAPVETNTSPFTFTETNGYHQRFYRGLYVP